MERFEFIRAGEEWLFRGTILAQSNEAAAEARYELACDHSFRTRRATVLLRTTAAEQTLEIAVENGRWFANSREVSSVSGALDIDLIWSPSTNTLPIRRLNLAPSQSSGEIIAAWVRFPELTLQPLPQEYFRISQDRYRYSGRGGSFTAELLVDSDGLIVDYGNFWQRVQNI